MASCEIFVMEIWKILALHVAEASKTAKLHSLQLFETQKNFVEYFGE